MELRDIKDILNEKGRVYLAAGWFDDEQFERCEAVRDIIKDSGFRIYSPKDEAIVNDSSDGDWRKAVFDMNVNNIKNASFMVCITDKKDIGTIYEAGEAHALGVPIVYFAETLGNNKFNLMLAQSGIAVVQSREALKEFLNNSNKLVHLLTMEPIEYDGRIE